MSSFRKWMVCREKAAWNGANECRHNPFNFLRKTFSCGLIAVYGNKMDESGKYVLANCKVHIVRGQFLCIFSVYVLFYFSLTMPKKCRTYRHLSNETIMVWGLIISHRVKGQFSCKLRNIVYLIRYGHGCEDVWYLGETLHKRMNGHRHDSSKLDFPKPVGIGCQLRKRFSFRRNIFLMNWRSQ